MAKIFEELPKRKHPVAAGGGGGGDAAPAPAGGGGSAPAAKSEGGGEKKESGASEENEAKRIRQAVYDIRYRARREDIDLRQAFSQYMQNSGLSQQERTAVRAKLFGKEGGGGVSEKYSDAGQIVSDHVATAFEKVFTEDADAPDKKYKVRVTDKATGRSYVRYATREKITQLRQNPNIQSVEMTEHGEPYEGERKSKKDYDGDGKKESSSKEHAGVVHNAIQKKKGGKQDGKDTRKEEYVITEEYINENVESAVDYFINEGINEDGLEKIVEEVGIDVFTEFVLGSPQQLNEERDAERDPNPTPYATVKAKIDKAETRRQTKKQREYATGASGGDPAPRKKKTTTPTVKPVTKKVSEPVKKKVEVATTTAKKTQSSTASSDKKGMFSKAKEFVRKGVERHNKAREAGRVPEARAKAFAGGVKSGVKTAVNVAKVAYKATQPASKTTQKATTKAQKAADQDKDGKVRTIDAGYEPEGEVVENRMTAYTAGMSDAQRDAATSKVSKSLADKMGRRSDTQAFSDRKKKTGLRLSDTGGKKRANTTGRGQPQQYRKSADSDEWSGRFPYGKSEIVQGKGSVKDLPASKTTQKATTKAQKAADKDKDGKVRTVDASYQPTAPTISEDLLDKMAKFMPKKKVKEDFIADALGAHSDGHVALMEPEDEVKDKPIDVMKGKNKVKISPNIGENVESVKKKNEKDPNGDAKKGEEDWRSMKTKRSLTLNKLRACGLRMGYEPKGEQLSDEVKLPKINKTVKMVKGIRKGVLPLDQTKIKEGTLPKKSEVHEQHGETVDGKFMSYATMRAKGISPKQTALQKVKKDIEDKHGKGAIHDPNKKETEEERKKREARTKKEREKREREKAKALAARAKKAGYKSTQDYVNVVARYGSEDNYNKGRGLD